MKKFAVVGNPIQHSLSPLLHNSIFEQLGINASYEKVKLLPADVESFVTRNEFDGYNVTIPHKNSIASCRLIFLFHEYGLILEQAFSHLISSSRRLCIACSHTSTHTSLRDLRNVTPPAWSSH